MELVRQIFLLLMLNAEVGTSTTVEVEINALLGLYNSADGINWNWRDVTLFGPKWNFSQYPESINPCSDNGAVWQGLRCSQDAVFCASTQECSIVDINLQSYNLFGIVPKELKELTFLRHLNLSLNRLFGQIPPELSSLTVLEYFDITVNRLLGPIPSELAALAALTYLDLSHNSFSGIIPSELGEMTGLQALYLLQNGLTGFIPSALGTITALTRLDISHNDLSGIIPPELSSLTGLTYLDLSYNGLSGNIPSELGVINGLSALLLNRNGFTGFIPPELSLLTALTNLELSHNNFFGSIPSELGGIAGLESLYLLQNRLTGFIPSELSKITALKKLDISHNYLFGIIPPELGSLTALTNLDISYNGIFGIIPSELGGMNELSALLLDKNKLTGFIPPELSSLTALTYLDLSYNGLSGNIPSVLSALTGLESLYLGYNRLTGLIPRELGTLTILKYLFLNDNCLSGYIPSELSALIRLNELSLGPNRLTGFIPSELGTLTILEYLYLSSNSLSGLIPCELNALSRLTSLYVGMNSLSGPIPSCLSSLTALEYLVFTSNRLSGPIPSELGVMTRLTLLDVSGNKLNGKAGHMFWNALNMSLVNVDISDNLFSGRIPSDIFLLPQVETVAMTLNCFSKSLPSTLCEARSVSVLSMDGMGAARDCKHQVSVPYTGIIMDNKLTGSIPACVWELPNITVLSLSGNGLTGTLSTLPPHSSMINLSLSHNHLEGTIPEEMQVFPFQLLDLSYNKLSGTCDSLTGAPPSSGKGNRSRVVLTVNRLSGALHQSVKWRSAVDVLTGNLFGCGTLPSNDKHVNTYSCGSLELDQSLLAFLSIAGCCCIGILFIACLWYFEKLHWIEKAWIKSQVWLSNIFMKRLDATSTLLTFNEQLRGAVKLTSLLMVMCIISCTLLCALKLVDNGTGNPAYSTHHSQYRWLYTAAYITGQLPAALLLGAWALCVSVFVCWMWRQYGAPASISLSHEKPFRLVNGIAVCSVILCNVGIVGVVNAVYIFTLTKNLSLRAHYGIQLGLTMFKLLWNYGSMSGILLHPLRHSPHGTWLTLVVCLANAMLIPCVVAAFASPSCYEGLLVASDEIQSTYSYDECKTSLILISKNEKICIDYEPVSVQVAPVIPPFTYNYMCTSAVLTAYIPVYLYIYCLQIVLTVGSRLIFPMYVTYDSLPLWLQPLCPGVMFPEHWQTSVSLAGASNSEHNREEAENTQHPLHESMAVAALAPGDASEHLHVPTPNKLLIVQNIVVSICYHITILLSFGLCSPVLAAAIGCTLFVSLQQLRLHIGRFLHIRESLCEAAEFVSVDTAVDTSSFPNKGSQDYALSCLEAAVAGSTVCFVTCIWPVVWFSCLFFAFLCWDMAGDRVGWKKALWMPVVAISVPLLIYLCKWVYCRYVKEMVVEGERAARTISSTRGLAMGGTLNDDVP